MVSLVVYNMALWGYFVFNNIEMQPMLWLFLICVHPIPNFPLVPIFITRWGGLLAADSNPRPQWSPLDVGPQANNVTLWSSYIDYSLYIYVFIPYVQPTYRPMPSGCPLGG